MTTLKRPKLVFKANYRLMQVESIAKCSKGSILQYFRSSFSYHLSLRSLFLSIFEWRFTQVLLYIILLQLQQNLYVPCFLVHLFQIHYPFLYALLINLGHVSGFVALRPKSTAMGPELQCLLRVKEELS